MMSSATRRTFFAQASLALASLALGSRRLLGAGHQARISADVLLSERLETIDLQMLAQHAVDAARDAGASYADIRIAERQTLSVVLRSEELIPSVSLSATFTYGIRALVDGVWSFTHGILPNRDRIAQSAQEAVRLARGYSTFVHHRVELAPAPTVTGTWHIPIMADPFMVPLDEHTAVLGALNEVGARVVGIGGQSGGRWTRETRVFASSEGSLVTQTLYRAPALTMNATNRGMGPLSLALPDRVPQSAGFEIVRDPTLPDRLKALAEETVRLASLPARSLDAGRYPVVFDGKTLGALMALTVGQSLEMDRVLGAEADASGTSLLAPPADVLGATLLSPLLSVTSGRAAPDSSACKWDDEGCETTTFPLIQNGRIVDYHTSRDTVTPLRTWYQRMGKPLASRGCAVASTASDPVSVRCGHLTISPVQQTASFDDLIRQMPHGVVVLQSPWFSTDQQFASASLNFATLFEVTQGKIRNRIAGSAIQLSTLPFWRSLMAVGDASTLQESVIGAYKGQPWKSASLGTTAPAGHFKEVNVIQLGRPR